MMNEFSSNMHLTGSQDALRSGEDAISSKLNTVRKKWWMVLKSGEF